MQNSFAARRALKALDTRGLTALGQAARRGDDRIRRAVDSAVEQLEARRLLAANVTWVNDNWHLVSDTNSDGVLGVGDIVDNRNDTGGAPTVIRAYGIDAFGTVTTSEVDGVTGTLDSADTINDAIANTNPGGIVNVLRGSYSEGVLVNKAVIIRGAQFDKAPNAAGRGIAANETVINAPADQAAFVVTASGATINGFMVQGGGLATQGIIEPTAVSGTNVRSNLISGVQGVGISIAAGSTGAQIIQNDVTDAHAGIYLSANASNATIQGNRLHGLTRQPPPFADAGSGIVLEGNNTNTSITANAIWGNRVGLYIWDGGDNYGGSAFENHNVDDNIISGNSIGIDTTGGPLLIRNNTIQPSAATGIGIRVTGNGWLNLGGGNAIINGATGILLDGAAVTVQGNSFNNLTLSGQGKYITITPGTLDNVELDATAVTFDGTTGAAKTVADNFVTEDRIDHATDDASAAFVRVEADKVFVTPGSGSIQRGIDAATAANTVNVKDGTYHQTININKALHLLGHGLPTLTVSSGTHQALVNVTASNVTVEGMHLAVNQPHAVAGVYMFRNGANPRTNLTVKDNTFTISGAYTAGAATPYVGFDTGSTAIAVRSDGGAATVNITGNQILPDDVGNIGAIFDRAIYLRIPNGTVSGNIIYGDAHDLVAQFVSEGNLQVSDNEFRGFGGRDTKGAQVDITEPNSSGSVTVTGNQFIPQAGTSPTGSTHVRSLMVKHADSNAPVVIDDNTFIVREVGVLSADSRNVTISNNTFTPADGDTSFVHVQVNNKVPTGGVVNPITTSVNITGNTFAEGAAAGGVGLQFLNHNSTPVPTGGLYGTYNITGNTFESNLDRFISLDAQSGASNTSGNPYYNEYGNTTMAPFAADLVATNNTFNVGTGDKTTATMTLAELFDLEDKIDHAVDAPGTTGFVRVMAGAVYVTPDSGSIQRGIDAAQPGDIVYIEGGTYTENLVINKAITLIGQTDMAGNPLVYLRPASNTTALIDITGNAFAATDDVSIQNINLNGVNGGFSATYGVRVANSARLDLVEVKNATIENFRQNGVGVYGAVSNAGKSAQRIALSDLVLNNNGTAGDPGAGDIDIFEFNGDVALSNLTLTGNATPSTGGRYGIQLRGVGTASDGSDYLPAGTISLDNIDISGNYRTAMLSLQHYSSLPSISFNDVALGGGTSAIVGGWGAALRIDAVSNATPIDLGNTHFRGIGGTGVFDLEFAPDNTFAFLRVDATGTTWRVGGSDIPAASLTTLQAHAVEDRILHYVDADHPTHNTPFKGFAEIKAGQAFITTTYGGVINRGIEMVDAGGTVHLAAGEYTQNVAINRHVKLVGAGTDATFLKQASAYTIVTITGSGASAADPVLIENLQVNPVGLGTQGIDIPDGANVSHLKLNNVHVIGTEPTNQGIDEIGFRIWDSANVDGLTITNSVFENLDSGMLIEKHLDIAGSSNVTNVTITDSSFSNNQNKGIYAEKLSNATFTNVVANDNGKAGLPSYSVNFSAGIDINLKGNVPAYSNLTFNNLTATGNGLTGTFGAGLMIKARSDGATYGANPATLTNVTVNGGTFTGNQNGIAIGEPDKGNVGPTGVTITGGAVITENVDAGVVVHGGQVTLTDVDFNSATADNAVDLRITAGAAGVEIGDNIAFAGDTYFIENLNTADHDLTDNVGITYDVAGNFAIEEKIYHKVDNAAVGLVKFADPSENIIYVSPTSSPTATDNDFTRIANAIAAAENGYTIVLGKNGTDGIFNWDEANALASWAKGVDGIAGNDDDWGVLLRNHLANVTITADLSDGITIQGPGDLDVDREAVFYAWGNNQNITIENFSILDVDSAIGFYHVSGANYSGLKISHMTIRLPGDSTAANDPSQNIGIHYGLGTNIQITNNVIEFAGDGDGTSVGMQSNSVGAANLNGLQISGNVLRVLNSGTESILGIWENGSSHGANITVSGNTFEVPDGVVSPNTTAFRLTSHSGAGGSIVKYEGNTVSGANVGFAWLATYLGNPVNFPASVQAIQLTNNTVSGTNIAVSIGGTNASAALAGNTFNGGAANGTDVLIQSGSGTVTFGAGNAFGAADYFIRNEDDQSITLSGYTLADNFNNVASNFRVEDKIFHKLDNASSGLVTWVADNIFVTTPEAGSTDSSIQTGVDVAQAGWTVNVEAGTYVENVQIGKDITLLSDAGRENTTIQGIAGAGRPGTIHLVNNTTGVRIGDVGKGFTIVGFDSASAGIENAAIYFDNAHSGTRIVGNDIVANGDVGLLTEFGYVLDDIVISDNIFSGQTFVGSTPAGEGFSQQFTLHNVPRQLVVIGSGAGNTLTTNIVFANNQITGTAGGINASSQEQGNTLVTIDALGAQITGNTFAGTTTRFGQQLRARGADNVVEGNTFTGTGMGANTADLYVNRTGNIIRGNTFSSSAGTAIQVDAGGSAAIGDTSAGGANTFDGYTAAITVGAATDTATASIVANTFSSNDVAVVFNAGTAGSAVTNNFFIGNQTGVLLSAAASGAHEVTANSFTDGVPVNGDAASQVGSDSRIGLDNQSAATVNATGNWWGSANGPTAPALNTSDALPKGVQVLNTGAGSVSIAPWLSIGDDMDLVAEGFQPNGLTAFIRNNEGETYATIQDAINGTENDGDGEIYIQAGSYAENIVLDRTVKLIAVTGFDVGNNPIPGGAVSVTSVTLNSGANVAGSTGVTSNTVTVNSGAKVQDGILLAADGAIVTVTDGTYTDPVVIDHALTLTASGNVTLDFAGKLFGLQVQSSNVTVNGFAITGDASTRFGIYIEGGATGRSNVAITNNTIAGIAGNNVGTGYSFGILADANVANTTFGDNSGLVITGNTIEAIGGGSNTGIAISLHEVVGAAAGDGAVITGNTIRNLNGLSAVGIEIGDDGVGHSNPSSGVEIADNDINAPAAIVAFAGDSTIGRGTSGAFGASTRLLVLNLGNHATVDVPSLGQHAATNRPLPAALFSVGLVNTSTGYAVTAQDAVSNSASGATVALSAGTFNENISISVEDLTLIGAGEGNTILDGTNTAVSVSANGVTVEGVTVTGNTNWGIGVSGVDGFTLRDVTLSNNGSDGILISASSNVVIENVTATGNGRHGVNLNTVNGATVTDLVANNNGTIPPAGATPNNGAGLNIGRTLAGTAGNVSVVGGTFSGNDIGINVYTNSGLIDGISIEGIVNANGNVVGGIVLFAEGSTDQIDDVTIGQVAGSSIALTGNAIGLWAFGNSDNVTVSAAFDKGSAATATGALITGRDAAGTDSPANVVIRNSSFDGYAAVSPAIALSSGNAIPGGPFASSNDVDARTGNSFDGQTGATPAELAYIETLIVHKPDSNGTLGSVDLGLVDYTSLGHLQVGLSSSTIDEGQSVTLTGSFTNEPKPHIVTIVWGDGSANTVLHLDAGDFDFEAIHTYVDDEFGGDDVYPISVTVQEDVVGTPEQDSTSTSVTVNNVAPQDLAITPAGGNVYEEGETLSFTASATDPAGANDTLSYAWTVLKDGATYTSGTGTAISFLADDNATYSIELEVTDEDGGLSTITYSGIVVANVDPTITTPFVLPPTAEEGDSFNLSAAATDPGSDTLTYTWTVLKDGAAYATGSGPNFVFTPNDNGNYEVTLLVEDGDGGSATQTENIVVSNVAPTVSIAGPTTGSEGSPLSYTSTVNDPGDDTFTYLWTVTKNGVNYPVTDNDGPSFTFTPDDDATYTVTLTVTDDDGGVGSDTIGSITVGDVDPTVVVEALSASIDENSFASLTFRLVDPGAGDLAATGQVTINWGNGTQTVINNSTAPALLTALRNGEAITVTHQYVDDDPAGTSSDTYNITISSTQTGPTLTYNNMDITGPSAVIVNNLAPTGVFLTSTPSVPAGSAVSVNWIDQDDASPNDVAAGLRYSYGIDANNNGQLDAGEYVIGDGTWAGSTVSDSVSIPGTYFTTPGTYTILGQIIDDDGGVTTESQTVEVTATTFRVTSLVPTASGFVVNFNRAFDRDVLNLYNGVGGALGPADVVLTGPGGVTVRGSIKIGADGKSFEFVKTGGILAPGSYSVTLISGDDGFKDTSGEHLDGDNNLSAGGNYLGNFNVAAPTGPVLSIPDFARGPGQDVDVPPSDAQPLLPTTNLPVRISSPVAISSINFQINYDPSLLDIAPTGAVTLGSAVPAGWNVGYSIAGGVITVSLTKSGGGVANIPASASPVELVKIAATVPGSATYGAAQVLSFSNIVVNGASGIVATGDSAFHKAVFLGDANASGSVTVGDATLIQGVVLGNTSGYNAMPLVDPVIITDSSRNGVVDAQDVTNVVLTDAGVRPDDIPAFTPISLAPGATIDPTFAMGNVSAGLGQSVIVPVDVTDDARGVAGGKLVFYYDTTKLDLTNTDVTAGALINGWTVVANVDDAAGQATVVFLDPAAVGIDGASAVTGTLLNVAFDVSESATGGTTAITIAPPTAGEDSPTRFSDASGNVMITNAVDGSIDIDAAAPKIADVLVSGSAWSADFVDYLATAGYGQGGYSLIRGADQLKTLPWTNIDQVSIRFTEDVAASLDVGDMVLYGVDGPIAVSSFVYDPASFTATWTLPTSIAADKLRIVIASTGVSDAAGNALDGEWTDGAAAGTQSGNNVPGGDFRFRFNVLPGDANQDGFVLAADALLVRNQLTLGTGSAGYNAYADVDGSGMILSGDALAVRNRLTTSLPDGEPEGASLFSQSVIADSEAEDELDLIAAVQSGTAAVLWN